MTFSNLAQCFEKLEGTSKRLEMIDILSNLFKESSAAEIGKIMYLIQGRVAPYFEPIEIGMAEMLVAQAIGRAYGESKDDVVALYRKKGNMGLAAQELAQKHKHKGDPSVTQVFNDLLKIANHSGKGTVDQKVSGFSDILKSLDPISVKHVVNIPLGTLRLGIGDPTVMDALSLAKKGDKSLRPILEDAYNKTSDLGYVAETYFKHGEEGLKKVHLIVGKPVRPALAERLPSADEAVKRLGDKFVAEPKFDGFRIAVHKDGDKVELFSRNLEDMTHMFPDLVEGVRKEVHAKSVILEGEAIAYNPVTQEFLPFQETTKRRRKYEVEQMAKDMPLVLFAFDILYLNGRDITELPQTERRKKLEDVTMEHNLVVRLAEQRVLHSAKQITEFFNEAVSEGLEGLMLKKLDSPYKAGGRGFHWVKFKRASAGALTDTVDCVLLGVYSGRGKRTEFGVGGLLVGVYNEKEDKFETISRIGTGLTDDEFRKVNKIANKLKLSHKPARVTAKIEPSYWVEPKVVMEIYADEITKGPIHTAGEKDGFGYALRFPRLVKFRGDDKRAEDATTVTEIKKLYANQYAGLKKKK
ncbi:MAG: ATP-dependent DNA ligase [Candidatus Curtissbacteria bacterium]|nr:ATP-dependent DNA ligase [Candidatus Curtissbacteria bacterium]